MNPKRPITSDTDTGDVSPRTLAVILPRVSGPLVETAKLASRWTHSTAQSKPKGQKQFLNFGNFEELLDCLTQNEIWMNFAKELSLLIMVSHVLISWLHHQALCLHLLAYEVFSLKAYIGIYNNILLPKGLSLNELKIEFSISWILLLNKVFFINL